MNEKRLAEIEQRRKNGSSTTIEFDELLAEVKRLRKLEVRICPQCRAATETCKALGSVAEALEKMVADGVCERLGHEMARAREKRILEALTKNV